MSSAGANNGPTISHPPRGRLLAYLFAIVLLAWLGFIAISSQFNQPPGPVTPGSAQPSYGESFTTAPTTSP